MANEQYTFTAEIAASGGSTTLYFEVGDNFGASGGSICSLQEITTGADNYVKKTCVVPDTNTATTLYLQFKTNTTTAYMYADNVTGRWTGTYPADTQPSCSRDGVDLSKINCTGTTFTTENPDFDTASGEAMALFDGTWYQITSVVSDTALDMTEDISCTSCSGQTTRLLKELKSAHGGTQLKWLLNEWRSATDPIQMFWSSYTFFGNRYATGLYTIPGGRGVGFDECLQGLNPCGFGAEHDFLIDELEALETSGSGKIVLIPTGDEHTVILSKWSTFDIYELFLSGLGMYNGNEILYRDTSGTSMIENKEADYPGLAMKAIGGGGSNYGLIFFDTSSKSWTVEVRDEENRTQVWWDGSKLAYGSEAWFSSPRGLDNTVTEVNYPDWIFMTGGRNVARLSTGYCWKIGGQYNASDKFTLRRTADTDCSDWLSSSAYTYDLNTGSASHTFGSSIIATSDDSALLVYFYDATSPPPYHGTLKKCTLTGTPPTVSTCTVATGNPDIGSQGSMIQDKNSYLYIAEKQVDPTVTLQARVASSTTADSVNIGSFTDLSDDTDTGNHLPIIVELNSTTGDVMLGWFTPDTDKFRTRVCSAGANGYCESTEWGTTAVVVTDTYIGYTSPANEFPHLGALGDGTAVLAYVTQKNANTDARSQLKYVYYNGSSWGTPTEITGVGWRLKDAQVFTGGGAYFIGLIDEVTDRVVVYRSTDGSTWDAIAAPVIESNRGKMRLKIDQLDSNTVAVTYLSASDQNHYLENDEFTVWGQSVTQIWTYLQGKWRLKNVNPHINHLNPTIN